LPHAIVEYVVQVSTWAWRIRIGMWSMLAKTSVKARAAAILGAMKHATPEICTIRESIMDDVEITRLNIECYRRMLQTEPNELVREAIQKQACALRKALNAVTP
jgi:hypothetical protein